MCIIEFTSLGESVAWQILPKEHSAHSPVQRSQTEARRYSEKVLRERSGINPSASAFATNLGVIQIMARTPRA